MKFEKEDKRLEKGKSGADKDARKGKRGRKRFNKKDDRVEERHDEFVDKSKYTSGHNDLSWLLHNPNLAKVASRVPFGNPIGYRIPFLKATPANQGVTPDPDTYIPGIMRISSVLTLGVAEDINSPINQAALNLWTFLRHAGTGSLVDDPNDVAFYFGGIAQLLAMAGWLRRIVGELTAVNPLNRYIRRGLIFAEGLDYDDLVSHMSEFLFFVTWFCAQVNNFVFPKLPYFDQAYTAFHYVYKDEMIAKSQCYIIAPLGFGVLDFTTSEEGTMMSYVSPFLDGDEWDASPDGFMLSGSNIPFAGIKAMALKALNVLLNEQSIATLSAAVLKAYGAEGLWRLQDLDELHVELECVADPELIMQIHNAYVGEWAFEVMDNGDLSYLRYESRVPAAESGQAPYIVSVTLLEELNGLVNTHKYKLTVSQYFDMFTEVPSEGEVILASRLKSVTGFGYTDDGGTIHYSVGLKSCDAILPFGYTIITMRNGNPTHYEVDQLVFSSWKDEFSIPCEFQAAPICWRILGVNSRKPIVRGEVHNFTTVDDKVIQDLHLNNMLSLFDVPKFGAQ